MRLSTEDYREELRRRAGFVDQSGWGERPAHRGAVEVITDPNDPRGYAARQLRRVPS